MTKASEDELAALHGAIARGLAAVISEGVSVVVGKGEDAVVEKVPASAAYFMAGITLLKNNSITADASSNKELDDLTKALKERRQRAKGRLSGKELDAAAAIFERDLPGFEP